MTKTGAAARPPLDSETDSALEFLQRYQRPLTIGVILVALAGGGTWMYTRSAEIREVRAAEALNASGGAFRTGDIDGAQPELQRVATRYAGTAAGAQAASISAQWYFEAGKADSGLLVLEPAISKAPRHLRAGMLSLRAAGKAAQGDAAGAAKDFEAAASAAQFRQERDGFLMSAARNYSAAGDSANAKRIYEEISGREDSLHAAEARLRLGEIRVKS